MYSVKKHEGKGFDMNNAKIRPTIEFQVVADDGTVAWRSGCYYASAAPRSIQGLRLQASNMAKRYEAYLQSTGKRYEIVLKQEREAELAAKKAERERIERIRKAAPELLAALEELFNSCKANHEPDTSNDQFRMGWGAAHDKIGAFIGGVLAKAKGNA